MPSICKIFHQVFLNDALILQYTKQLSITSKLNVKTIQCEDQNSLLGIYFLNQLIKNNMLPLNKCQINLNEWLFKQILQCCAPIHPIIITFINTYINQMHGVNTPNENRLLPISDDSIFIYFKNS